MAENKREVRGEVVDEVGDKVADDFEVVAVDTASPQSEATPAASPAYEIAPQLLVRLINL